ncbi:hypothetical protein AGOR_G00125880 [Albula goreensis]|uniref:Uncharacterized protein n=1 Tax=Albula goreensis TaxID=1534307 RepID=A0A8T3D7X4_9TELE|nr:hypothetical protein AGOR_G00125880 [Albula goreensis]
MDSKALCLLRSTVFFSSLYLMSVSCEMSPQESAHNDTVMATAMQTMTKTTLVAVGDKPTPVSHITKQGEMHAPVTLIQTTTGTKRRTTQMSHTDIPSPKGSNSSALTCTGSGFHAGSFIGGVVLTVTMALAVLLGYKLSRFRPEVRYRTIQEVHDAII